MCRIAWKKWYKLWIEFLNLIENYYVKLLWLNVLRPSDCVNLKRHVAWFELLWLNVVRPSECDHLARHVVWYELLWYWSWIIALWDWVCRCVTLNKFYLDVLWWITIWIGSDECASGLVHLNDHIDDDPREERRLISLLSCYVCMFARDGGYLQLGTSWGLTRITRTR